MTPLELDDKRRDPTHWAYKKKDKTAYQMIADWDLKVTFWQYCPSTFTYVKHFRTAKLLHKTLAGKMYSCIQGGMGDFLFIRDIPPKVGQTT